MTDAEIEFVSPIMSQYNLYAKCRYLGIKMGPEDIDPVTLDHLYIVKQRIEEIEEKKRNRKRK